MFAIKAEIDASRVPLLLERREKRIRAASYIALTKTAKDAQRELERMMPLVFDRPTPWTLRSLRTQPATMERLEAAVLFKDRDAGDVMGEKSHLWAQVRGGPRRHKPFEGRFRHYGLLAPGEYLVPAPDAPQDAYGNVPASVIVQILSQLRIANAPDNSGYDSNVKRGARQSAQSKRRQLKAGTFFLAPRGGPLPLGVYQRKKKSTRAIFWIARQPAYRVRLDMRRIVDDVRRRELQQHFNAAIRRFMDKE